MTDKKIIIDGIDVSNCVYLPYCEDKQGNCGNNPNCYYKQLQRKIIECEELKGRIKCNCFDPKSNNNRCASYNRITEDYERDLRNLKNKIDECEGLKYRIRELEQKINYLKNEGSILLAEKNALQIGYDEYSEMFKETKKENDTLQDFRQLVREKFPFDDSDITDDEFIKYLQEYIDYNNLMLKTLMELTNILDIDWTVHGVDCDVIKSECRKLKGKQNG